MALGGLQRKGPAGLECHWRLPRLGEELHERKQRPLNGLMGRMTRAVKQGLRKAA
jgi:hypothetical protein